MIGIMIEDHCVRYKSINLLYHNKQERQSLSARPAFFRFSAFSGYDNSLRRLTKPTVISGMYSTGTRNHINITLQEVKKLSGANVYHGI